MLERIFIEHPKSTGNPQDYFTHRDNAIRESSKLIIAGIVGVIHGLVPCISPFYSSTQVIKSFKGLVDSRRHKEELKKEGMGNYLYSRYFGDNI